MGQSFGRGVTASGGGGVGAGRGVACVYLELSQLLKLASKVTSAVL